MPEGRINAAVPAVPTVNPLTGKRFVSEEERQEFIEEQKVKMVANRQAAKEILAVRQEAVEKLKSILMDNGMTEEQFRLIFGNKAMRGLAR